MPPQSNASSSDRASHAAAEGVTLRARLDFADPSDILERLSERGTDYFASLRGDRARVEILSVVDRSDARLIRAALQGRNAREEVIVKMRSNNAPEVPDLAAPWLRLCPWPHERINGRYEAAALDLIHSQFASGDARFNAVPMLDAVEEWNGLVMGVAAGAPLDGVLLPSPRWRPPSPQAPVLESWTRAGAWLRRYHEIPGPVEGYVDRPDRESTVRSLLWTLGFIEEDAGPWRNRLSARAAEFTERALPASLPLTRVHGDYWGGNILVAPDERITVIDTFGYGQSSPYEDIAYFLLHLRATKRQVLTHGKWCRPRDIAARESAFLQGYFAGREAAMAEIRAFEVLATAFRWAHAEYMTRQTSGAVKLKKQASLAWKRRFYRRFLEERVNLLEKTVKHLGPWPLPCEVLA